MTTTRFRSPISDAELERRWSLVRAAMAANDVEVLVMQNASDWVGGYVRWFTDVAAANGYPRTVLFPAAGPMTSIEMGPFGGSVEVRDAEPSRRGLGRMLQTPAFASVGYSNGYDAELVVAELGRMGARRVGLLAPGALPHAVVAALRERLPDATLIDFTDQVDAIKAVKSPEEIAALHQVAALQDAVFAAVCGFIRPGLRDIEVANFAQGEAHRLGSDQGILLGSSAPLGVAARFMGRAMQGRAIEKGDHFSLLIEVNGPSGLYTEIARTIVLGRASDQLKDSFELMRAAQEHTLAQIRPGAAPAAIAAAHDEWMRAHGLPPERRLYAHGQGTDMVERPLIREDETMALAEGMCLAVHPGYDDGTVFAVICDNYMIEAHGVGACMHKTEKRLFEL